MRITYKGDYALKALLDLAFNYGKNLVTINELATHIDAPVKFLEQVLLNLKRGGFVESKRGNIGGYQLSRHPGKITLGEVIRYIDGPIEPISCVAVDYSKCNDSYKCIFRKVWRDVYESTAKIVDSVTFERLAADAIKEQDVLRYVI